MAIVTIKFSSVTGIHRTKLVQEDNSIPHIDTQCIALVYQFCSTFTWQKINTPQPINVNYYLVVQLGRSLNHVVGQQPKASFGREDQVRKISGVEAWCLLAVTSSTETNYQSVVRDVQAFLEEDDGDEELEAWTRNVCTMIKYQFCGIYM